MARKKDERALRRKERKSRGTTNNDAESLSEQLAKIGLKVRDVVGDGNCLFRALADQLEGDDRAHGRHRQDVVRYMTEHRSDFEPFIEDDVPFDTHIKNLAQDGTYAGNDAIVAFARLHKLTIIIHQLGSPAWEVHGEVYDSSSGSGGSVALQLHILYHNSEHYSSVRRIKDDSDSPANVRIIPARPLPPTPSSGAKYKKCSDMGNNACSDSSFEHRQGNGGSDYEAEFVAKVMASTKCRDESLVQDLCSDADYYDFDSVCCQILAIMDESLLSMSEVCLTPSDPDIALATDNTCSAPGAKPKAQQQQTAKRRQRKQEKKARAASRHKQELIGVNKIAHSSDEDDQASCVITQNIKVLQI